MDQRKISVTKVCGPTLLALRRGEGGVQFPEKALPNT